MSVDTRITWLDRDKRRIMGYVLPYGDEDHQFEPQGTHAGITRLFYVTSRTAAHTEPRLFLNVNHANEAAGEPGFVGEIRELSQENDGWMVLADLWQRTADFSINGEFLPALIDAGRLYFCCELLMAPQDITDQGEALQTFIHGATLTTTPARVVRPVLP